VSSVDRATAAALADRIGATCVEALLDWGEAVNAAEATPDDKTLSLLARAHGSRALELAMRLAEKLRPRGR
jgi:hypothetical protein